MIAANLGEWTAIDWAVAAVGLLATGAGWVRWARVAQREHYHPGSLVRIARLWVRAVPVNRILAGLLALSVVMVIAAAVTSSNALAVAGALLGPGAAVLFPWRLAWRGRGRPLVWTRRLVRLSALTGLVAALAGAVLALLSIPLWCLPAVAAAALVPLGEAGLMLAVPLEDRLAQRFQHRAEQRLRRVAPRVIAVTGSWGKTTTKNHIRQLVGDALPTAISPASFNNRGGLSRTMNEHLPDNTELLVVEMGMYGPGEIRDLCRWVRPEVGVITAIGPMHLERVGSIEGIVAAKSEIVEQTAAAVLWVDQPELAELAEHLDRSPATQRVIRCGTTTGLDVVVQTVDAQLRISVGDTELGAVHLGPGLHPANVGCAVGALIAVGLDTSLIARHLDRLSAPEHRATEQTTPSGIVMIDDTFNSNPVGARHALGRLATLGSGRRVMVTPGMIELGPLQHRENEELARDAARLGIEVMVVGRTNRAALMAGAADGGRPARWVPDRESARTALATELGAGDAVLWENDLPDHYP